MLWIVQVWSPLYQRWFECAGGPHWSPLCALLMANFFEEQYASKGYMYRITVA